MRSQSTQSAVKLIACQLQLQYDAQASEETNARLAQLETTKLQREC